MNAQRRRFPMVKLEKESIFQGADGPTTLKDLFAGQRQLITYHFIFGPDWKKAARVALGFVNALGDLSQLQERDTTCAITSRAPIEKLQAYKTEMRWDRIKGNQLLLLTSEVTGSD